MDLGNPTPYQLLATAITRAINDSDRIDEPSLPEITDLQGYEAQALSFAALGQPRAGSKLALKTEAVAAPLLWTNRGTEQAYLPGLAIEVEFALQLERDLPLGARVTRADILDAIGSVSLGVELIRSRYKTGSSRVLGMALADFFANVGYVLGPTLSKSVLEPNAVTPLRLTAAGVTLAEGPARHADTDPLKVLVDAAARATLPDARAILSAGQVLTTGSLCGIVTLPRPGAVTIELGGQVLTVNFRELGTA
ncbi:hypothetical protein [Paracoccus litorisediminis]|uniref:2-keto-4-pentenoate hydratase n=1 Tax=Paracoccus litorisediminis TaxID=2006130 RepID=A0A844HUN4_9RHOB|nr:hypothetical protein [Paracoccus litorisediminis]MTH62174.1 hypothetical protein [Paracoccus litorisediminis]